MACAPSSIRLTTYVTTRRLFIVQAVSTSTPFCTACIATAPDAMPGENVRTTYPTPASSAVRAAHRPPSVRRPTMAATPSRPSEKSAVSWTAIPARSRTRCASPMAPATRARRAGNGAGTTAASLAAEAPVVVAVAEPSGSRTGRAAGPESGLVTVLDVAFTVVTPRVRDASLAPSRGGSSTNGGSRVRRVPEAPGRISRSGHGSPQ